MPTLGVRAARKKRTKLIQAAVVVVLVGGFLLFVKTQKDTLVREASRFLQRTLSRESGLDVKIGRIGGRLSGSIQFEDVRVEDPSEPDGERLLFAAREARFRTRFLDLLTKRFDSKIEMTLVKPVVRWRPSGGLRHEPFPFLRWMREWALSQKSRLRVDVQDLELILGPGSRFEEIGLTYENDTLSAQIPIRHRSVRGADISTTIRVEGRFVLGLGGADDVLRGELGTEGTVINWTPLPQESKFDFELSRGALRLSSPDFLGGVALDGTMDFKEGEIRWRFTAADWPLSNLNAFLRLGSETKLPTRASFDVLFEGNPRAPNIQGYLRLEDGWLGKNEFQALDLHAEGVYPTLRLEDSRVLTKDGVVMKFADTTLEVEDLFYDRTYRELVGGAEQDTVAWGSWKLTRQEAESAEPDFLMQRSLGTHAKLNFRKFAAESGDGHDPTEPPQMEVGFEYRLKSEDSLKVGLRDEERFVGVEHKMSF